MKVLLIFNPISGSGKGKKVALEIYEHIKNKNIKIDLIETESKQDLQNSLLESAKDYSLVLVCGGDGTFRDAMETMVSIDSPCPVGLIPAGSGNDFGKAFGIKNKSKELVDIYLESEETNVYGVNYNNSYLINVFGVGIDVAILKKRESVKYLKGAFAYFIAALITLFTYKTKEYRVKLDNEIIEGKFFIVSVCNGQYIGGGMRIGPNADMNSNEFEIIMMRKTSRFKLLKGFANIYKGKHVDLPYIDSYKSKTVCIEFIEEGEDMNVDGDVYYEENKVYLVKDQEASLRLKKPYLINK